MSSSTAEHPSGQPGHGGRKPRSRRVRRPHGLTAVVAVIAAVWVAGAAVAVLNTQPTPPGPAQRSTYQETLNVLSVNVGALDDPVNGSYFVVSPDPYHDGLNTVTFSSDRVLQVDGEVVRLYAQRYPFKKAPVVVKSATLSTYQFAFSIVAAPSVTTRYQLKLFVHAADRTPLEISSIYTIYVRSSVTPPGLT